MPTGHALPLGPSFGLREPNGWMPRIYSGHPIPALRPEQSDHVPWADCPQGLSSTSVRCAHPPGKSPLLPIFERGSSQCRAQTNWLANSCHRARSCSLFSSFKKGKAFSLRCLSPLCFPAVGAGQAQPMRVGMLRRKLGGFAASISRPLFQLTAGGGLIQPTLLGMLRYGWDGFAVQKNGLAFFLCRWRYTCSTGAAWDNPV